MISLISITNPPKENEIKFLYFLLKNRRVSISHKEMPSFEEHRIFVSNHPYKTWNIVIKENINIGAQYIGYDNKLGYIYFPNTLIIGLTIITKVLEKFSPEPGRSSLIPNEFVFNVAYGDDDYLMT